MNRLLIGLVAVSVCVCGGWWTLKERSTTAAAASAAAGEFAEGWYFNDRPAKLRSLEGKPAPALEVKNWIGKPQKLSDLKGSVVVVDFWATWCGPCMRSLPHNVQLMKQHEKDGLMFIGVHEPNRGTEKMAKVAKDQKINYPLSIDSGGKTIAAYGVTFFPTYVVIDRSGVVRAAGLTPDHVGDVVAKLLKEEAQSPTPPKKK